MKDVSCVDLYKPTLGEPHPKRDRRLVCPSRTKTPAIRLPPLFPALTGHISLLWFHSHGTVLLSSCCENLPSLRRRGRRWFSFNPTPPPS